MTSLEKIEAASRLEYACAPCKDWGDDAVGSAHFPCPRCRPELFKAWLAERPPPERLPVPGDVVVVLSTGLRHRVVLPSAFAELGFRGDDHIQPCQPSEGEPCREVILVQLEPDGLVRWADLADVEVVTEEGQCAP